MGSKINSGLRGGAGVALSGISSNELFNKISSPNTPKKVAEKCRKELQKRGVYSVGGVRV